MKILAGSNIGQNSLLLSFLHSFIYFLMHHTYTSDPLFVLIVMHD